MVKVNCNVLIIKLDYSNMFLLHLYMDEKTKSIGEQLKEAREKAGLTQLELYEKSKITPYTISQLENGKEGVNLDTILKLQKALNIKFSI